MLVQPCVLLTLFCLGGSDSFAQAAGQQAASSNTREEKLAAESDGWPIHATYYESAAGKESPVVILLAGAEGLDKKDARNRRVWQNTALALQKSGFAVMTVDLRKHGDSIPEATEADSPLLKMVPNDYVFMTARDMEAVKTFLLNEHQSEKLNIRKTGIVAVGSSAMVAAAFTTPLTTALLLLSIMLLPCAMISFVYSPNFSVALSMSPSMVSNTRTTSKW